MATPKPVAIPEAQGQDEKPVSPAEALAAMTMVMYPPEILKRMIALSSRRGISVAALTAQALDEFLKRAESGT
jgi:hypothetical protein